MTDEQNMADLFANLNAISANSVLRDRQVRGGGGGSMPLQGNQDPNPLIALNPYLGKNVTSFNMGGMMNQRNMLAPYISTQMMTPLGRYNEGGKNKTAATPQEENLVRSLPNSGIVNPYTGVPAYGFGGFLSSLSSSLSNLVGGIGDVVDDVVTPITAPIFDAAGNIIDPVAQAASDIGTTAIETASNVAGDLGGLGADIVQEGLSTVSDVATDVGQNIIEPVLSPVFDAAGDVIEPVVEGAANVIQPLAGGFLDLVDQAIQGGLSGVKGFGFGVMDTIGDVVGNLLGGGSGGSLDLGLRPGPAPKRKANIKRGFGPTPTFGPNPNMRNIGALQQRSKKQDTQAMGDFVSPKDNPFITPNVEEELDYAAQGMKMPNYNMGGNMGGFYGQKANEAIAVNQLSGLVANLANRQAMGQRRAAQMKMEKGGAFKPHMMYDPKTGKEYKANKVEDHNRMSKKGFTHTKPNKKRNFTNGGRF